MVLLCAAHGAPAQTRTDAGALLREMEKSIPQAAPQAATPKLELPAREAPVADTGLRVRITGFRFSGTSLVNESELQALLADQVGRELTLAQLQATALHVGEYYRAKGYFARALLPRQAIENGVVEIQVVEGRLGEVQVSPQSTLQRLEPEVARQFVLAQQRAGAALQPEALQKGLRLLNELPGVQAIGGLLGGRSPGESNFFVKIDEEPLLASQVVLDNFGSDSTGKERLMANLAINDPGGLGDQIRLLALGASGTQFLSASYQRPFGTHGLHASINASSLQYRMVGALANLDANGTADALALALVYPLQRSAGADWDLGAGAGSKHLVNNAVGQNTSNKNIRSYFLGLSASLRDPIGGGGQSQLEAKLVAGELGLTDNATDAANDQISANSQGSFDRLVYSASRLQKINHSTGLYVGLNGQFSNHNLDSGEQFSLGGPNGIRAFSANEASGDEGWLLNTELRYQLSALLQVQAFLDTGAISLHRDAWIGWDAARPGQPNRYTLSGAGFGLSCKLPQNFVLKGTLAWIIGNNPGAANNRDSDASNEQPRVWLQLSKTL